MKINAKNTDFKILNESIHKAIETGHKKIVLDNVNGQRYIGTGIGADIKFTINGVPGNDLAAFMDGPEIIVNANVQDGTGNTMNSGRIIVYGDTGDITGHSMRGGEIYIKGRVGYRTGIHMKSYKEQYPVIIIGGRAGDFLGEYMAGGLIILLGLKKEKGKPVIGSYCGTGMHGGAMYIRGEAEDYLLGKEIKKTELTAEDEIILNKYLKEYGKYFTVDIKKIKKTDFIKLVPSSSRPYGKLYAY